MAFGIPRQMLDQVEALLALHEAGTVGAAAARLRLTPSAVSKRVGALEARVGSPVVERVGRRLRLTPTGEALVADLLPLMGRLREALSTTRPDRALVLGSSPALFGSWLPAALREAQTRTGTRLELHARRGPVTVERVLAGAFDLGVAVDAGASAELEVVSLGAEAMVLVGAPASGAVEVWSIESSSLTWQAIARPLERHAPEVRVVGRVESFAALVQLARAGFAPALVPVGVARAMGESSWRELPGVARPVAVVCRAGVVSRQSAFIGALRDAAAAVLA